MNAIVLTISDITVRQDSFGRFCLNDLHKAAGNESKHKPDNWLRLDSTKEIINELDQFSDMRSVEVVKGGKAPGTWGCKEAMYSYAMWISAKFHIAVIRAYDALMTAPRYGLVELPAEPLRKTQKALPGCLTLETQDEIKQLINDQAALLPKEKQASFIISAWSALGTHFGVKKEEGDKTPAYKRIPEGARLECLSLIARLPSVDVITLPRADFEAKIEERVKALEGQLLEKPVENSITMTFNNSSIGESYLVKSRDGSIKVQSIERDVFAMTEDQFIRYLTQECGYIVVKKTEVAEKLMA